MRQKNDNVDHMQVAPEPIIQGAPTLCFRCEAPLCLRKQVINLALGCDIQMLCLNCLSFDSHQGASQIMDRVKGYILNRDCFHREWVRYTTRASCPDPHGCLIDQCFAEG